MDNALLLLILLTQFYLFKLLFKLKRQNKMNQAELLTALSDIGTKLNKAKDEIIAALAAAGTLTPEVEAAVNNIGTIAQELDDLNPDAPAPTP